MHSTETTKPNNVKPLKGNVYILSTTNENFSPNIKKKIYYYLTTITVGLEYQSSALQSYLDEGLHR